MRRESDTQRRSSHAGLNRVNARADAKWGFARLRLAARSACDDGSRIVRVIGCEEEFTVLRDFVRTHLFERFPILYGAASGGGTILLLGWAAWLASGLGAIAAGPWILAV